MWPGKKLTSQSLLLGFLVPCLKIVGVVSRFMLFGIKTQLCFLSYLLALSTASRSKLLLDHCFGQYSPCCEHPIFYWQPGRKLISGEFFFRTIKVLFILSIFQISASFAKEVVRPLNAISLLCSLWAAQEHNYKHSECAYAIWFLFLLPALSNQSQLLQCRQNQKQLQHCLSSNCGEQSLWKCAWGEQDRGPLVWLRWGNETQPQTEGKLL